MRFLLMHDRLLVARGRRGSRDALRCIYEKYRDKLLIVAIALSHDVNVAEDAVHDVFVAFAENLPCFELTGSLKAYLATCVANRVRDLMRRKRRTPTDPKPASSAASERDEPGRLVVGNEELQMLSSALAQLPQEQREVIVLRLHGQLRFRAIAEATGVSVNTVKGRYRYGIVNLRSMLNGEV
jgi:RNA polymerase sigma factor (sigma-70 family)